MWLHQFFKAIFFLFFVCEEIFAQTKTKATVSPFVIEENVLGGQNFTREIILTNNSDEKLNFSIILRDIKLDEKGNIVFLDPKIKRFSLADWIQIKEKEVELLPGESKKIEVYFNIPEKAVGSREGVIIFASKPKELGGEREGVFGAFSHQIGVLVFLFSKEGATEEAKIVSFKTDKNYYSTPFLIKFQTEIENFGNVYIEPKGKIEIRNFFQKKVGEIIFNPQNFKVLPESKRIFENIWQGKFGFGKYNATLYLVFGTPKDQGGSGVKTIYAQTFFWIFPLREILFGILIFFLVFYFFYSLLKRYRKRY